MRRCAALLVVNPETNQKEWKLFHNPTIGDLYLLRNKGAIIMRQTISKYGNGTIKFWITDMGTIVIERIDFKGLPNE